ncbi:MAG: FG-GAP repeat protein, partial [Candidatus Latescibacterota bacterium]
MNKLLKRWALLSGLVAFGFLMGDSVYAQMQTEDAKHVPGDGAAKDLFGDAVAVSGNLAIIGAPGDDVVSTFRSNNGTVYQVRAGSVYFYEFDGVNWNPNGKMVASNRTGRQHSSTMNYGQAISLLGNRLLIGSPGYDVPRNNGAEIDEGTVYAYEYDGNNWNQVGANFNPASKRPGFYMGNKISQSGDRALISAHGWQDNGIGGAVGGAYIYDYNAATHAWTESAILRPSDRAAKDNFGIGVSLSGDRAAIGKAFDDDKGTDSGSMYIFEYNGSSWVETVKFTANDGSAGAFFGHDVLL